ncbi:MAG: GNAT family N-acetyltransferase [Pseudomonadota bacterium]
MINWQWKKFEQLSARDLYAILQVRETVFVIEQQCIYQDIDDLDKKAWHLIGWDVKDSKTAEIVAYLRVIYPTYKYIEPAIGRILTLKKMRGTGLGKKLLTLALSKIGSEFPHQAIRISAQLQLKEFYTQFGFSQLSKPYDEDGILHIEMLKTLPSEISET